MTIFVNAALTVSKLKARYLEPYTSEVINRFFFTQGLIGIHYGFDIQPDPITGPLAVKLVHDSARARSLAVIPDYTQRLGFAFDEDTEQVLDLAANAGTRVYIFLYVAYTTSGTPTEIRLRVADAAELVNPWVNSALLLGTVRVPSVGSLSIGHIDKGSAIYAGLLAGGARRWSQHTTNPEFNKGLAGLEVARADANGVTYIAPGFSGGAGCLLLGDVSGTAGAEGPHVVGVVVPDVKVDDVILVRFVTNAVSVANGATLNVVIGSGYDEVIIDATVAAPEVFGILYTVTAADEALEVALALEMPNVNSTALCTVRRFEVFRLRTDVEVSGDHSSPDNVSGRILSFGKASDGSTSYFSHSGAQNHPVLFAPTTGNNTFSTKPIRITENDYTVPSLKVSDIGPSLLRASLQGTRAFGMMASLFPQAVIDGAALSVVLPDQVQLGSGVISAAAPATEADLYGAVADDAMLTPFDAAYNSFLTVSVPTTGNPVLVMWDGAEPDQTQRLIAIEAASVGSYPNATPLAWVEYDTGTNQITKLIDVRDKLINAQGKLTMYVGESSNNRARMSLEGALQLVGVFAGPSTLQGRAVARFEIVVSGYHTVARTLQLHSFVTIRGEAYGTGITGTQQARLLLAGGVTTMFTTGTASLQRVTFKDLDFATTDADCTAIKIENNTSITKLALKNCRFYTVANPWKYALDTGATNAYVNGMDLLGCEFVHGAASDDSFGVFLRDQSLSAAEIVVDRCKFDLQAPGTQLGTHLKINNNSTFTTHVTRSRFGLIQGDDFAGTFFGVDVSGNSNIDGCTFGCSVRCYPGTALVRHYTISNVKIERTGDGGGGLLDNTVGLVLEKGADNSTTIAQLSNVKVRTDALDPFGGQANVEGVSVRGAGNGTILVQMSNVHVTLPTGAGVVFVTGVYERASAGISQLQIDNLSVQGQNTGAAGTRAHGVWLGAQSARGTLKGLRMENLDDNRAVYFDTGAIKNILGFMTVLQTSAGAGYTEVVPAANTIQTTTIVVN